MDVTIRVYANEVDREANNIAESEIVGIARTAEELDELVSQWHSKACKTGSPFDLFAYYDQNGNVIDSYETAFIGLGGDPIEVYDLE